MPKATRFWLWVAGNAVGAAIVVTVLYADGANGRTIGQALGYIVLVNLILNPLFGRFVKRDVGLWLLIATSVGITALVLYAVTVSPAQNWPLFLSTALLTGSGAVTFYTRLAASRADMALNNQPPALAVATWRQASQLVLVVALVALGLSVALSQHPHLKGYHIVGWFVAAVGAVAIPTGVRSLREAIARQRYALNTREYGEAAGLTRPPFAPAPPRSPSARNAPPG